MIGVRVSISCLAGVKGPVEGNSELDDVLKTTSTNSMMGQAIINMSMLKAIRVIRDQCSLQEFSQPEIQVLSYTQRPIT